MKTNKKKKKEANVHTFIDLYMEFNLMERSTSK